ncbi:EthD domain-containing protein [Nocardioides alcanivorans]|uniref:EthD domain-containing protein n=1 Tax=Nocardioides alcanivorans TaxID=2897352 RepID=UPI001F2E0B3F|nr:EthD domain-containing protein [Nocardioides alcanivorans]
MIKAIALLARKPELTHAEFVDYYENNHSKLVRSLLPQIGDYRRNYIDRDSMVGAPTATDPDFDVITEMYFEDRAGFDAMLALHSTPEIRAAIEADEANFLDRTRTRMFVVNTHESTS